MNSTTKPCGKVTKARVRYSRGNQVQAVEAAYGAAVNANASRFVYGVYGGFVVEPAAPAFGQRHLEVRPDGSVYQHN